LRIRSVAAASASADGHYDFWGIGNVGENTSLPPTIFVFIIWPAMTLSGGEHFSASSEETRVGINWGKVESGGGSCRESFSVGYSRRLAQ